MSDPPVPLDDPLRKLRPHALPAGVVFDCDGTLADTESLSDRAWQASLAEHGYALTEADIRTVIGHPFHRTWEYFSQRAELGEPDRFRAGLHERYVALFDAELQLYDDAVGTVRRLVDHGVPVGVASSSSRAGVLRVLERAGIAELIGVVVAAEDVRAHKPAPEPYLRAAAAIGVDPRACTAVEDTPVGVRSARAAGMFTVAVLRSHGDADAFGHADRIVDEVTLRSVVAETLASDPVGRQPWKP